MDPAIKVLRNGSELVTVSTKGLNLVSVHVWGDRIGEEFATLDVSGGWYGEGAPETHLLWIPTLTLSDGDEIAVEFFEDGMSSAEGITIDEAYPEGEQGLMPKPPIEEVLQELAQRAIVRERFNFVLTLPDQSVVLAQTLTNDHQFGFAVTWSLFHSDPRARVRLSSNSLDGVLKRTGGHCHSAFRLATGERATIKVSG